MNNPLLLNDLEYPRFAEITSDHVEEAVNHLVADIERRIVKLENCADDSFASLYQQLEKIDVEVYRVWLPVVHLNRVKYRDQFCAVHDRMTLKIDELNLRFSQSEVIYGKILKLSQDKSLTAVQRRIVDLRLQEAKSTGVLLASEQRQRFNAIDKKLTELSTKFNNNARASHQEFEIVLTTAEQIAGLPNSFLQVASQRYRLAKEDKGSTAERGPWLVTLDDDSFDQFMKYSERRDLREKLYRAKISVASGEPFDNTSILSEIMQLRQEQARLLGFDNYAELSVSVKMAGQTDRVKQFLNELQVASYDKGKSEHQELVAYASQCGQREKFAHWDTSYWICRLEEDRFDLDEEKLRRYFPLPRVLQGIFKLCQILFAVEMQEHTSEVQVWHKDVKFYKVYKDGKQIAAFYLDPYSRQEKANSLGVGGWTGILTGRDRTSGQKPLCYVACNYPPPVSDQPSLLTFDDILLLFHELGHALHIMLTTVDYADISGMAGVEFDAVELPSQFMENFCYLESVIKDISQHIDSGDPLPIEILRQLQDKRTFRAASKILKMLYLSQIDLQLHEHFDCTEPFALAQHLSQQYLPVPTLADDRSLCSFSPIVTLENYAAGIYSYLWSQMLSADAFSLFRENGLETPEQLRKSGLRYRDTILALGGSMHPDTLYQKFRGRPPTTEALLQECGLMGRHHPLVN